MTVADLLLDLRAERNAVARYSERCQLFFEREDRARKRKDDDSARIFHDIGRLLGHAAYLEDTDPEPLR